MQHWTEEEGLEPIHTDAFGGRIFYVGFGQHGEDEVDADAIIDSECEAALEDVDDDDTEKVAAARSETKAALEAKFAHLIIHPNGSEVWTRTFSYALEIVNRTTRTPGAANLFM